MGENIGFQQIDSCPGAPGQVNPALPLLLSILPILVFVQNNRYQRPHKSQESTSLQESRDNSGGKFPTHEDRLTCERSAP